MDMKVEVVASHVDDAFDDFVQRRRAQRDWAALNGYYNGNLDLNGEYAVVKLVAPRCGLVLDVGYNEGVVSEKFCSFNPAVQVIGFDPNPRMPSRPTGHSVLRYALSDKGGETASFYVHRAFSGVSSLSERTQQNPSFRKDFDLIQVELQRLDDIYRDVVPRFDGDVFLKIDVEGAEAKVIRGAADFFRKYQPIGYFEYSEGWKESGELLQNLFYHLDEIGYCLYRVTPLGLEHIRFFHFTLENYLYQNLFYAPRGYLDSFMTPVRIPWDFSETLFYRFMD